ncbi:hypothetical protein NMY22_g8410 [Coprinellus aureogranulatus]|nr:hypothetical protein NMY22_g8410 [Coprinellus aureogranulatus]
MPAPLADCEAQPHFAIVIPRIQRNVLPIDLEAHTTSLVIFEKYATGDRATVEMINLARLLNELARRAEASSAAIPASSTPNLVTPANSTTVQHLEDGSETTGQGHAMEEAAAAAAPGVGVGCSVFFEMINALLDLAVYDARTAKRGEASSGLVAATAETVAPFATITSHRQVFDVPVAASLDSHRSLRGVRSRHGCPM